MWQALFGQKQQTYQPTSVKNISVHDLSKMIANDDNIELLDVRSPMEYEYDGHIAGSRLIPLQTLSQRLQELPQDKTIVCICRSGNRSYTACEMLSAQGFTNVINLSGGMIDWKRNRLPHQ